MNLCKDKGIVKLIAKFVFEMCKTDVLFKKGKGLKWLDKGL